MKKSNYLIALALGVSTITFAQNVGINTDGSDPDANTILHIKNHATSSLDSALLRIENGKSTSGTGVQIENSGTASSKWDIIVPGSSTDLRIKGNGSDHVTIQNDGDVGISTTTPVSGLDVKTSMGYNINTFYPSNLPSSLDNTHNVVLCNDGDYTVNLPAANTCKGRVYYIKNIDAEGDDITIDGNSIETIDGSTTYVLDEYNYAVRIISDGNNWHVIDEFNPICCGGSSIGTISSLDCGSVTGPKWASGVSVNEYISVPYTGDVAGSHSGQTVTSTGVTGLTASLASGVFASSGTSGFLSYHITGTPSTTGTASFTLSIGGQSCVLTREVTCGGDVTFTYNGVSVTYGTISTSTGKCWMDRNLGAEDEATSKTDASAYGDLFQWGRAADGHQVRTSSTHNGSSSRPSSITASGAWDGKFIYGPGDWVSTQTDNAWNTGTEVAPVKSSFTDPCPSGWRIPTEAEWSNELTDESITNATSAYNSALKLPVAGRRDNSNGSLVNVGLYGYYWSSTSIAGGTDARYLHLSGNASMVTVNRAHGRSVRCIKE